MPLCLSESRAAMTRIKRGAGRVANAQASDQHARRLEAPGPLAANPCQLLLRSFHGARHEVLAVRHDAELIAVPGERHALAIRGLRLADEFPTVHGESGTTFSAQSSSDDGNLLAALTVVPSRAVGTSKDGPVGFRSTERGARRVSP